MIQVAMFYPQTDSSHFDMDYFLQKHIPRIRESFKNLGLLRVDVEQGVGGAAPGQPAPYAVISTFLFEGIEGFQQGMAVHGGWIIGDVPNYTNVQPQVQVSHVVVSE